MKLAWIVWKYDDSEMTIMFTPPDCWYHKVISIVYAEIKEGAPE